MKTLHLYLLRQVLATLVMTVLVFTFILLLGESLKEILALLINGQVGGALVAKAFALLIPFILVFALPMGLLAATLLVFGRFSADQELTAARACGISLVSLAAPILALATLCAGLCAFINLHLAPECRAAYRRLLVEVGTTQGTSWLAQQTFIRDFPGYLLYVGKVDGLNLQDVIVYQLDAEGHKQNYLWAESGGITVDSTNRVVSLTLRQGRQFLTDAGIEPAWHPFGEIELPPFRLPSVLTERTKLNNMSFRQLLQELRDLEDRVKPATAVGKVESARLHEMLREAAAASELLTEPVRVQIHRQLSFSFACIGFALLGIPLAIRAHRRETSVGFAIALVLVLVYYSFFILAQSLETRPHLYPHVLVWIPNFLFQGVGAVLLWRANRR